MHCWQSTLPGSERARVMSTNILFADIEKSAKSVYRLRKKSIINHDDDDHILLLVQ